MEYLEATKQILKSVDTPLTFDQLWEEFERLNESGGKTKAHLKNKLFAEIVENSNSIFEIIKNDPIEIRLKKTSFLKKIWRDKFEILIGFREIIFVIAAITTLIALYFTYETLKKTADGIDSSTTNSIYSTNNSPSVDFLFQHPELFKYFDKYGWENITITQKDREEFATKQPNLCEHTKVSDENCIKQFVLLREFNNLGKSIEGEKPKDSKDIAEEEKTKQLILSGAVMYCDVAEMTFIQRNLIPDCDWHGWWNYYCDFYDESPVIRKYLEDRKEWYLFDDAVKKGKRDTFQIMNNKDSNKIKQFIDNNCFNQKKYREVR